MIEHQLSIAFSQAHPFYWPVIPEKKPHWRQRRARYTDMEINAALAEVGHGPLTQEMRDAYWREVRKGQGLHEDAGGYGLRQWLAALGFVTPAALVQPTAETEGK